MQIFFWRCSVLAPCFAHFPLPYDTPTSVVPPGPKPLGFRGKRFYCSSFSGHCILCGSQFRQSRSTEAPSAPRSHLRSQFQIACVQNGGSRPGCGWRLGPQRRLRGDGRFAVTCDNTAGAKIKRQNLISFNSVTLGDHLELQFVFKI